MFSILLKSVYDFMSFIGNIYAPFPPNIWRENLARKFGGKLLHGYVTTLPRMRIHFSTAIKNGLTFSSR